MRQKQILSILLVGFFILISAVSFGQEHEGPVNTKEGINEMINHHLHDSHYFDFFADGEEGTHYGFALPVILIDNGVHIFSAAQFDRGNELVEKGGQHYRLYDSKIYKTNAEGEIDFDKNGFPSNERPWDFSITKNVMVIFLVAFFMLLFFGAMAKTYKKQNLPRKFGRFMEPVILFVRDDIAKEIIGPKYKKYMPWLLTIFFFILFLNFLGMFPFGVNVTGNITITFALSLLTFVIVQFSGNKNYWKHVFWFPDVHPIVKIILIPIEILGLFTKPFALMIRLFANMTAGHVIIMSLLGLIVVFQNWFAGPAFFGFSLFMMLIEILVAVLQAYIFTLLSALYIAGAVEEHHAEDVENGDVPIV